MQAVWKFLNAPLIVVLIALAIWPLLTVYSGSYALSKEVKNITNTVTGAFSSMGNKQKQKSQAMLAVKKQLALSNIKIGTSSWKHQEKIIGTISNNSDKNIKSLHIAVSAYDANDQLMDVDNSWLSNIKILSAGESIDFSYNRSLGQHNAAEEELARHRASRVKVVVTGFDIIEE
ncbi:MAG: FxLYD domain-containing protein [Thioalkalispiraceae bacterium]|jgi:hypothetical protein